MPYDSTFNTIKDREIYRKLVETSRLKELREDMTGEVTQTTKDDLVDRLRGIYSLGPFGERNFHGKFVPPIQAEAADEIMRLRHDIRMLKTVLNAILDADERGQGLPYETAMDEAAKLLKRIPPRAGGTSWRRSMFENMKALADEIVQDNGDPADNDYQRGYMDASKEIAKRIREIIAEAVADNDIATVF